MHDLDRVQLEFDPNEEEFEFGSEMELELESGGIVNDSSETEGTFDEAEEMELAAELLGVSSDQELDQFLGNWIRRVGKKARGALSSAAGRAIGNVLKGTIKRALPGVAGIAGNFLAPGIGGVLGSKAGSAAGSLLGLELEGLSPEDQEFEAARQLVRFGNNAMEHAMDAPEGEMPQDVALNALTAAANRYAPGLLRNTQNGRRSHRQQGTWRRVGSRIILEGL